jgi:hypothetical protein
MTRTAATIASRAFADANTRDTEFPPFRAHPEMRE